MYISINLHSSAINLGEETVKVKAMAFIQSIIIATILIVLSLFLIIRCASLEMVFDNFFKVTSILLITQGSIEDFLID